VTASLDGTARLWDSVSGQEIATLKPHQGEPVLQMKSAAFNRDGTLVVTASADQTARVWDVGWATKMRGEDLADQTCTKKLVGAKKFTRGDEDAVLVRLQGIDACARDGPMSWDDLGQRIVWLLRSLRDWLFALTGLTSKP
jgi:WD40 repeat protein